jgi:cystathionine beta-synthase
MKNVFGNILETIGNTPLIRLNSISRGLSSSVTIYTKCEFFNPSGSVKDRVAKHIIDKAEKRGDIKRGGTIVEATSGNTGMGIALVAAIRGYKAILVMPDKVSKEKIDGLKAYGAEVVMCPTNVEPEDPKSYYSVAKRLAKEHNGLLANQYHNPDNPETHYLSTGPEIWEQLEGKVDMFVTGLGTGGTVTGISKYLKEKSSKVLTVGADPIGSIYYEYFHTKKMGPAHQYLVEGIGEDFLPSTIDFKYIDDVIQVTDKECFDYTRRLLREEGHFVGGSCGAAMACAVKAAQKYGPKMQRLNMVVLMPDSGNRYLSKVYNDDYLRSHKML